MLDKFAGYKTQIRVLEKKLKEMDHSKLNPAKVKELTEAIQNLKEIVKEKEDKKIERKKKKEEAAKPAEVEATTQPTEVVKESAPEPAEEVVKEADVNKFAVDSKVEPIRGTAGSWGTVIREAGVNGDPLVYVKWNEGHLKTAHGDYGAYYPSDLRLKVEAKSPTDYVPREQVYNLEADYKGKLGKMIKDLEEEIKTAYDKGEAVWAHRLEQKLSDAKKALGEESEKTAEDENGSGGTNKLKVVDLNPAYDKDPQEKSTGYGGDRPMGAMVAPNGEENSLPLESAKKCPHCTPNEMCGPCQRDYDEEFGDKTASLKKDAINITVAEKLFVVNPLQKTADNEFVYDVSLADGSRLFKITSKDEMGQEHLTYVIGKELTKEATIQKHYALYINNSLATRTMTRNKAERIAREKFPQAFASGEYKIVREEFPPKPSPAPRMAKLTSNLAFLKKGSFVSILDVDNTKKQVKFASLDNSLRGWAPMQKFAAYDVPSAKLVDHENHKDEVLAESGTELLVTCPANSNNVIWREITAPPATPESLNPDVTASKNVCYNCQSNPKMDCKECGGTGYVEKKADGIEEQPDSEDIFIHDEREGTFAGNQHVGLIAKLQNDDWNAFYNEIKNWMDSHNFFPTVWQVSDHGNVHLDTDWIEWFGKQSGEVKASLNKSAHIRHEDGKWIVYNHDYTKTLGSYPTKEEALKRLRQIEFYKKQGNLQPLSKKEANVAPGACPRCGTDINPGTEFCDTCKKNIKEANVMETKCEECGKELGPEVFLSKWPVCGKCTKKRHEKAVGKRASDELTLEQQVQGFRDRMQTVNDRLATPPAKTADLETTQDLTNVDVKDLSEGILHMIDMIESKVGTDVSADPSLHPMLEDLENKVYEVEMKLGIKPNLPEHEALEPEHREIVEEVEKSSSVEVKADDVNTPPQTLPPAGFKYAWDPKNMAWILVQITGAPGGGI